MTYYLLYKLKFSTPVHFGDSSSAKSVESSTNTLCADTLFSALCHEAMRTFGQEGISGLLQAVRDNTLRFTDLFPYSGEILYLPRPVFPPRKAAQVDVADRKALKKLSWLPIEELSEFCLSLNGETKLDIERLTNQFGTYAVDTKVSLRSGDDSVPYRVGSFHFFEDCGLYGVVSSDDASCLERCLGLLERLGYTGLGGKLSSGYGKFSIDEYAEADSAHPCKNAQVESIFNGLREQGKLQMLLTTALPQESECAAALDGAFYTLRRRGGFIQSADFSENAQKKQTQYYLSAGSIFRNRFEGGLYEVSLCRGTHPVFRYSYPLFMGVEL